MAPSVLITGLQGFTGRYMADEMTSAGYQVYGLGEVDLQDFAGLKMACDQIQPDYVIHLAALAFVGHGDPNSFYGVNTVGTRNLLQVLANLAKKPQGVLLASSANVYGNVAEGVLNESTLPNPANDYAVSKLAMEYMAKLWMDKLPIVITRPFNYTGVGQSLQFLLPKIVSHFKQGARTIELGNIDVWRDFSDVRALVVAYRQLLEANAFGHIVNVCSGQMHSLRDVISICEAACGYSIDIKVNPAFVRSNEVKVLCGDATLLHSLVGDWTTPTLAETLHWMLAE